MSDTKDPAGGGQQKAIDGVLFGDVRRRPRTALPRRRFIDSHAANAASDPKQNAAEPAPVLPKPTDSDELSDLNVPLDLPEPPLSKRDARKQKKAQKRKDKAGKPRFWRHPIKAIKSWSWKKRILWLFVLLVFLVGGTLGYLFVKAYLNSKKVFKGGGHAVALQETVDPNMLKGEGDGRINVLLLGIGGGSHEAPDLTDTIIVASIDPVNHKADLLSVPRDLWVKIPGHGSMKINAAYEMGKYDYLGKQDSSNNNQQAIEAGFKSTDSVVESVLGIPIHYNMLVNFSAFQQAVDTVGGITINVPETLSDPTFARENGGSSIIARAGTQTFGGKTALMYVRSRHTSSDFARAQRQRAVIVALEQKMFTLGTLSSPSKISGLLDTFGSNVVTDLSLSNVSRLMTIMKKIPEASIVSVGLTDTGSNFLTTDMISGQSVVVPIAGTYDYTAIQNFVRNKLRDGYLAKEDAKVLVLNGTSEAGLADSVATTLKSYGYNVIGTGDAPTQAYTKTTIVDLTKGKDKYTLNYLKKRYNGAQATTTLPDKTIQTQNADFVIILGEDETTNS
ncbi:MAG TPA: LCP family protein [Candidatus Saccharimonadales bacterium]|nr:LCP family protein [Candidatus Saccharimonadales bacterium]